MLDVSFSELVVVFIVALVVLGPERLPKAARLVGALIGKIRRTANDIKYEFNREIELQEMKQRIEALQKQSAQLLENSINHTSTIPEENKKQNEVIKDEENKTQ